MVLQLLLVAFITSFLTYILQSCKTLNMVLTHQPDRNVSLRWQSKASERWLPWQSLTQSGTPRFRHGFSLSQLLWGAEKLAWVLLTITLFIPLNWLRESELNVCAANETWSNVNFLKNDKCWGRATEQSLPQDGQNCCWFDETEIVWVFFFFFEY